MDKCFLYQTLSNTTGWDLIQNNNNLKYHKQKRVSERLNELNSVIAAKHINY